MEKTRIHLLCMLSQPQQMRTNHAHIHTQQEKDTTTVSKRKRGAYRGSPGEFFTHQALRSSQRPSFLVLVLPFQAIVSFVVVIVVVLVHRFACLCVYVCKGGKENTKMTSSHPANFMDAQPISGVIVQGKKRRKQ
jgi:hypothetical protein